MKRLWSLAALVASTALAGTVPQAIFPYPMHVDTLPNGLTVCRVPFHSPGLVAYYTAMRVGSRNEVEPHHTGFAHFFEHMMFRGTVLHPGGDRAKILGRLGFDDNAFTSDDATIYHSLGPSSALKTLIEIEADRFQHLSYAEPAFQTEAKAVLGEYHKNAAHPELKLEETLDATGFTQHPYRHTTLGFYEDVQAMPTEYEYSKQFFQRWYTPDNAMLFIVGDFDDAQVMQWVRAAYSPWTGKSAHVDIPVEPQQKAAREARIEWESATLPREVVAWHVPSANPKQRDGAIENLVMPYLVGPTSPLYRTLVLEEQKVESIGSGWGDHRDPSLYSIWATIKDEKDRVAVREALAQAVADLAAGKVDVARLESIKSNLHYGLLMGLETPDQVALQLAYNAAVLGVPNALDLEYQNIAKVQPKQLVAFAKKYLVPTNRTTVELHVKPKTAQTPPAGAPAGGAR